MAQSYADRVPPFHTEPGRDTNRPPYGSPPIEGQMGMPPPPSAEETMSSVENGAAPPPAAAAAPPPPFPPSSDAPSYKEERAYPGRVAAPLIGAANAQPGMWGSGGDQADLLDVPSLDAAAPKTPIFEERGRRSLGNLGSDAREDQGPLTLGPEAPSSINKERPGQQSLSTDHAPAPKEGLDRALLGYGGDQADLSPHDAPRAINKERLGQQPPPTDLAPAPKEGIDRDPLGYGGDQVGLSAPDARSSINKDRPGQQPPPTDLAPAPKEEVDRAPLGYGGDQPELSPPDAPNSINKERPGQQPPPTDLAPASNEEVDRTPLGYGGSQAELSPSNAADTPIDEKARATPLPEEGKIEGLRDFDLPVEKDAASNDREIEAGTAPPPSDEKEAGTPPPPSSDHSAGTPPPPPPEGAKPSSPARAPISGEKNVDTATNSKPSFLQEVLDVAPQKVPYSEQEEIRSEAPADNDQSRITELPKPPFLDEVLEVAPQKVPFSEQEEISTEAPADNDQARSIDPSKADRSGFQKDLDAPKFDMEGAPSSGDTDKNQFQSFDTPKTDSSRSLNVIDTGLPGKDDDQPRSFEHSERDSSFPSKDTDAQAEPKEDQMKAGPPVNVPVEPKDDQTEVVPVEPKDDQKEAAPPVYSPVKPIEKEDEKDDAPAEPAPPLSDSATDQPRSFDLPEGDAGLQVDGNQPRSIEMDSSISPKDIDAPVQSKDDQKEVAPEEPKDDQKESASPVNTPMEQKDDAPVELKDDQTKIATPLDTPLEQTDDWKDNVPLETITPLDINASVQPKDDQKDDVRVEPRDDQKVAAPPVEAPVEPRDDQKEVAPTVDAQVEPRELTPPVDAPVEPSDDQKEVAPPLDALVVPREDQKEVSPVDAPEEPKDDKPRSVGLLDMDSSMPPMDVDAPVQPKDDVKGVPQDAPVEPMGDQKEVAPKNIDAAVENDQKEVAPPKDKDAPVEPIDDQKEVPPPVDAPVQPQTRSFDPTEIDNNMPPKATEGPVQPEEDVPVDVSVEPKGDEKAVAPFVSSPMEPKDYQTRNIDLSEIDSNNPPKDVDAPVQPKDTEKEVAPLVDAPVEPMDDQKELVPPVDSPVEPKDFQPRSVDLSEDSMPPKNIDAPVQPKGDKESAPMEPMDDQKEVIIPEDAPVEPMDDQKEVIIPEDAPVEPKDDQPSSIPPKDKDIDAPVQPKEDKESAPVDALVEPMDDQKELILPEDAPVELKDDQPRSIDLSDIDSSMPPKDKDIDAPVQPKDDKESAPVDVPVEPVDAQKEVIPPEDAPMEPKEDQPRSIDLSDIDSNMPPKDKDLDAPVQPKDDDKEGALVDAPLEPMDDQKELVPPKVAPLEPKDDQPRSIDLSDMDSNMPPKNIDSPVEPKDDQKEVVPPVDAPVEPKDELPESTDVSDIGAPVERTNDQTEVVPPEPKDYQPRSIDVSGMNSSMPLQYVDAPIQPKDDEKEAAPPVDAPVELMDDQKKDAPPVDEPLESMDDRTRDAPPVDAVEPKDFKPRSIDPSAMDNSLSPKDIDAPVQPEDDEKEVAPPVDASMEPKDDQKEVASPIDAPVEPKDHQPRSIDLPQMESSMPPKDIDAPVLPIDDNEDAPVEPKEDQTEIAPLVDAPGEPKYDQPRSIDPSEVDSSIPKEIDASVQPDDDETPPVYAPVEPKDDQPRSIDSFEMDSSMPPKDIDASVQLKDDEAPPVEPPVEPKDDQPRSIGLSEMDSSTPPKDIDASVQPKDDEAPPVEPPVEPQDDQPRSIGLSEMDSSRPPKDVDAPAQPKDDEAPPVDAPMEPKGDQSRSIDLSEMHRSMAPKDVDAPVQPKDDKNEDAQAEPKDLKEVAPPVDASAESKDYKKGAHKDLPFLDEVLAVAPQMVPYSEQEEIYTEAPADGKGREPGSQKPATDSNVDTSLGASQEGLDNEPDGEKLQDGILSAQGEGYGVFDEGQPRNNLGDNTDTELDKQALPTGGIFIRGPPDEVEAQRKSDVQGEGYGVLDVDQPKIDVGSIADPQLEKDGPEIIERGLPTEGRKPEERAAALKGKEEGKTDQGNLTTGQVEAEGYNIYTGQPENVTYDVPSVFPVGADSTGPSPSLAAENEGQQRDPAQGKLSQNEDEGGVDAKLSTPGSGDNLYPSGDQQFARNVHIPKQDVGLSVSPVVEGEKTDVGLSESPYTQYDGKDEYLNKGYGGESYEALRHSTEVPLKKPLPSPVVEGGKTDVGLSESPYTQYDGKDEYLDKGYGGESYDASRRPIEVPLKKPLRSNLDQQYVPEDNRKPSELGVSSTGYDRDYEVGINKAGHDDDYEDGKPSFIEKIVPCLNTSAEDEPSTRAHEHGGEGEKPVVVADQQDQQLHTEQFGKNVDPKRSASADEKNAGIGRTPSDYDSMAKYGEDPHSARPHAFPHPQPEDLAPVDPRFAGKPHEEQQHWLQKHGDHAHPHTHHRKSVLQKIKEKLSPSS